MSTPPIHLVLLAIALLAPDARATDGAWSGTVTLESSFESSETHDTGGGDLCESGTGTERVRTTYRATARLRAGAAS
jgi:hypothetical protein